jgi:hypothetical protein
MTRRNQDGVLVDVRNLRKEYATGRGRFTTCCPGLRPVENVALPLVARGKSKKEAMQEAIHWLSEVGQAMVLPRFSLPTIWFWRGVVNGFCCWPVGKS